MHRYLPWSLFLCSFLIRVAKVLCDPCSEKESLDISSGDVFADGYVLHNGVRFPPKYVYSRNVSGEMKLFGCVCKIKHCLRKCCPLNEVMMGRNCSLLPDDDILTRNGVDTFYYNAFLKTVDITNFQLFFGKPCEEVFVEDDGPEYLQEDGNLFVELLLRIPPWQSKPPDHYCIDTFVSEDESGNRTTRLDALVCFDDEKDEEPRVLNSAFMLISCVFILATLAVYAWLPELRNLHGKVLMAYLTSFFFGFSLFATMQILLEIESIDVDACIRLTIVIYFFLLSAFFWLNVMCFDIWWTFSGKRGLSLEKLSSMGRFYAYACYSYGIPMLLTILLAALEFSDLPLHPFLPSLRRQGCFISGNARIIYFYGPILVLCLANITFFILTALKIASVNRETSVLKSKESATHERQGNDRQRFLLYIKLFAVMGINWILEIVSEFFPKADMLWRITDSYNVLIGIVIFVIFICKRKIFRLIKRRYHQIRGDLLSSTQTEMSRMSSRDEHSRTVTKSNDD